MTLENPKNSVNLYFILSCTDMEPKAGVVITNSCSKVILQALNNTFIIHLFLKLCQ